MKKAVKIFVVVLVPVIVLTAVGGFFYWHHLKQSPVYSLALIIDAAQRDDDETVASLIDVDAVADDFVPQITVKAHERYGRSLPPAAVEKLTLFVRPFLPAIKATAAAQLPKTIKARTARFADIPFPLMVIGGDRYVDITYDGDTAFVKSLRGDRPLEVEMQKRGDRWVITAVKDEQTASMIAEKIGQQIIALAASDNLNQAGRTIGVENFQELIRQAEELIK